MNQILQVYGALKMTLRGITQLEDASVKLSQQLVNIQKNSNQSKLFSEYEIYLLQNPKALEEHIKALEYSIETLEEKRTVVASVDLFWKWMVSFLNIMIVNH
jgi:hypothetical protein